MGRRESDQEGASGASDRNERSRDPLVITGWIMIVGALLWAWMVFFAEQSETGLWIAGAVGGLGYLLQRAGSQAP